MYGDAYKGWPGFKGIWMYVWEGEKKEKEEVIEEVFKKENENEESEIESEPENDDSVVTTDAEDKGGLTGDQLRVFYGDFY